MCSAMLSRVHKPRRLTPEAAPNRKQVLLKATGRPPVLHLPDGKTYHIFMCACQGRLEHDPTHARAACCLACGRSHTWKTGQDQVAVIKNKLTQLLPEVAVFLGADARKLAIPVCAHRCSLCADVDDLEDISELETCVQRSNLVLVFVSKGYFLSKNCLREACPGPNSRGPAHIAATAAPRLPSACPIAAAGGSTARPSFVAHPRGATLARGRAARAAASRMPARHPR